MMSLANDILRILSRDYIFSTGWKYNKLKVKGGFEYFRGSAGLIIT